MAKKQVVVEPIHELTVEGMISSEDLDSINLPENLAKLRFCIQPGHLIPVVKVVKIYPTGQLDLQTTQHSVPAPTGMRGGPSRHNLDVDFAKVRRDDSGREAGTYKILG